MSSAQLKGLQSCVNRMKDNIAALEEELIEKRRVKEDRKTFIIEHNVELYKYSKEISALEEKVKASKAALEQTRGQLISLRRGSAKPTISEHAIVRYLERIEGVDMDEVRSRILPRDLEDQIREDGSYNAGTHRIKVRDRTITTVVTNKVTKSATFKKRKRG